MITEHLIWLKRMTLEKATLPVPQFDQITLVQLQQQIEQAIQQGQKFFKRPERKSLNRFRHSLRS